jgi:hypothetical protein
MLTFQTLNPRSSEEGRQIVYHLKCWVATRCLCVFENTKKIMAGIQGLLLVLATVSTLFVWPLMGSSRTGAYAGLVACDVKSSSLTICRIVLHIATFQFLMNGAYEDERVFWDTVPCSLVEDGRSPCWLRQYAHQKRQSASTKLRVSMSQKQLSSNYTRPAACWCAQEECRMWRM